jgi:hypothetical protein
MPQSAIGNQQLAIKKPPPFPDSPRRRPADASIDAPAEVCAPIRMKYTL